MCVCKGMQWCTVQLRERVSVCPVRVGQERGSSADLGTDKGRCNVFMNNYH